MSAEALRLNSAITVARTPAGIQLRAGDNPPMEVAERLWQLLQRIQASDPAPQWLQAIHAAAPEFPLSAVDQLLQQMAAQGILVPTVAHGPARIRLRTDLLVHAGVDEGLPVFDLVAPGGAAVRVGEWLYAALQRLGGSTIDRWCADVAQEFPAVSAEGALRALRYCHERGLLVGDAPELEAAKPDESHVVPANPFVAFEPDDFIERSFDQLQSGEQPLQAAEPEESTAANTDADRNIDELADAQRRMARRNRLILGFLAAAVFVAGWVPIPSSVSGEVTLMPISRVEVISGIDGFVRDVHVTEGDIVELGALIAELDRTELEKLVRRREAELSEAENELAVLERGSRPEEVARAKRLVESRRQSARVALAQRQRLTDLYARKFASSDEVSAAEIKYVEAASQVAEAQADLKILQAGARPEDIARRAAVVEAKRIDLSIAKGQLGATRLLAPSAGIVIGDMHAAKHRHLTVGESLCQIANLTKMRAVARLDESALAHVKPGAEVSLKIVSQPNRVFSSKVTFVSPAIEKVDGSRHFRVETELDNPERLLRPNESGYLKVHTGSRSLWISFINYVSAKTRTVFVF